MRRPIWITLSIVAITFFGFSIPATNAGDEQADLEATPILWVYEQFGMELPEHYISNPDPSLIAIGEELVKKGKSNSPSGKSGSFISPYFVCTDCHNQVKEDPDPVNPNPEARLEYALQNDIGFLQSTTFWGIVNRESWYNDDYIKKYGELVIPASKSLYESTQLCAQECSSGRMLKEWEWEAINHYYHSLQLTIGDLNLDEKSLNIVLALKTGATAVDEDQEQMLVANMKSKYMLRSPAKFQEPSIAKANDQGKTGNKENGERVFEQSCMTCHAYGGPSQLVLENDRLTKRKFRRNLGKGNYWDLYTIIRGGTYAELGHQQYMPLYTLDRLSEEQFADLRAFLCER